MACRIALFCEDAAHENFGRALILRCAADIGVSITLTVPTARFGIPRLKAEIAAYQSVIHRTGGTPDLLVVLVDANNVGVNSRKTEVAAALDPTLLPAWVIGVPDPYVERWMLADPTSFAELFGRQPDVGAVNDRFAWKRRLIAALEESGEIVTQGGAEFADEIVASMDLYRAGRVAPSLNLFVSDLVAALHRLKLACDGF